MKSQISPVHCGDDDYNLTDDFPFYTLAEAADYLDIRTARMSRLLRILQIPVHKVGTLVLLNKEAVQRVEKALDENEVRRGRKSNASK